MKKIKILKSFPSTHYGYLKKDSEPEVSDQFADYAVKRMKAAEYVEIKSKKRKK